jgi:hypothetical protein
MSYGLRMITKSISIGTSFDIFFSNDDMPDFPHAPGYELFEDINTTPSGNTYLYSRGKIKTWELDFKDITEFGKNALEHLCHGWAGSQQITIIYYGTAVTGTSEAAGGYSSSQIFGTGYMRVTSKAQETAFGLWDIGVTFKQFGPDQSFT